MATAIMTSGVLAAAFLVNRIDPLAVQLWAIADEVALPKDHAWDADVSDKACPLVTREALARMTSKVWGVEYVSNPIDGLTGRETEVDEWTLSRNVNPLWLRVVTVSLHQRTEDCVVYVNLTGP